MVISGEMEFGHLILDAKFGEDHINFVCIRLPDIRLVSPAKFQYENSKIETSREICKRNSILKWL